jgi:hypothetical protein
VPAKEGELLEKTINSQFHCVILLVIVLMGFLNEGQDND